MKIEATTKNILQFEFKYLKFKSLISIIIIFFILGETFSQFFHLVVLFSYHFLHVGHLGQLIDLLFQLVLHA
jgi:hypothetical protein